MDKYDNVNMLPSYSLQMSASLLIYIYLLAVLAGNFDVGATKIQNKTVMWLKPKLKLPLILQIIQQPKY